VKTKKGEEVIEWEMLRSSLSLTAVRKRGKETAWREKKKKILILSARGVGRKAVHTATDQVKGWKGKGDLGGGAERPVVGKN